MHTPRARLDTPIHGFFLRFREWNMCKQKKTFKLLKKMHYAEKYKIDFLPNCVMQS